MASTFKAVLAVAILSLAPAALAQGAGSTVEFGALDTDKDQRVSKAEYDAFMVQAFTQMDKNGNGSLTPAETTGILTVEQFTTLDANGDGRVSRDEFITHVSNDFAASDHDRSGSLN